MSKQGKSRKSLVVGIVAAVVVLAALLVVLLTQCNVGATKPTDSETTTVPATTEQSTPVIESADLYWNVDRAKYDGKSEGGMSSRPIGSDGFFHVRFFNNGQIMELRVANRSLVNKIEIHDLMGLVFDEDGVVVDMVPIDDMPVEKVGWKFYVQSIGGHIIKVNSSDKFNGMEVLLEKGSNTKVYDMTGVSGEIGCEADAALNDRVMGVSDLNGNLLAVYIYDRSNMVIEFDAYCQHCEKQVTWQEWKNEKALPLVSGHYKLVSDIKVSGQQSMKADAKICLDLNGHRVDGAEGKRIYSVHNLNDELAIMDTSEKQDGRFAAHGEAKDQGMCILVRYGAFYLYSGILDGSDAVVNHGSGSTTVYVAAGRFFYMNGGELIGGKSMWSRNETTGKYQNGIGGNVFIKGKMVMNGGVIRDGQAVSVSYTKDGKKTYERGIGGNIYLSSGSVFEMNGGTIKNGKAGTGGNIFADGTAELTINGGTISGGRANDPGRNAGNIYIGSKATLVMNGGTITGGTTKNLSGNIHLLGAMTMNGGYIGNGKCLDATTGKVKATASSGNLYIGNGATFAMFGGNIKGSVYAVDSSTTDGKSTRVVLSGYATIDGAEEGRCNLNIASGAEPVKVTVGTLRDRAVIGITASGVFSLKTKAENLDNFRSDVPGAEVLYYNECLALGKLECLCGKDTHYGKCDGTELLWGPWTSDNSLPTAEGNYYLLKDVTRTGGYSIGNSKMTAEDKNTVSIDLNGKTVSITKYRAYLTYGDLNIVDHAGGGKMTGTGPSTGKDHTGVILVAGVSEVSVYGGTIALAEDHFNLTHGGVFGVASTATLNIYGGTIDGSKAASSRTETIVHEPAEGEEEGTTETVTVATTVGKGGAIRVTGTLNIHGGTIIGGTTTTNSGAIFAEKAPATVNMYGGTVTGGAAVQGGNFYMASGSKLNLKGGTVIGGKTVADSKGATTNSNGGNIYLISGAVVNISGGSVEGGVSANGGGNMYSSGELNISGGKISGGMTDLSKQPYTLNLMLINSTTHISGGVVEGYVTATNSVENGSVFKLSGKPVITGGEYNLRLTSYPATLKVPVVEIEGVLAEGSDISMYTVGVITGETVQENVKFFHADDSFYSSILTEDKKIAIGYVHCLCGKDTHAEWCDGKDLLWMPWDGSTSLTASGNYYLTKNVTSGGQRSIGVSGKDLTINLDLFGKQYMSAGRAMLVHSNLNIVDSVGGGLLAGSGGAAKDHTGTLLIAKGGVVNLYQGTLSVTDKLKETTNGGVVGIGGGGTMNLYPEGVVDATNASVTDWGGAVRVTGTFNILGGTVKGGYATKIGGSIVVLDGGHLNMTSGTVEGGKASSGGNIGFLEGTTGSITGGTVKGGEAANVAGNIYLAWVDTSKNVENPQLTIGGNAKVEGGFNTNAGKHGGSIHVSSNTNLILEGNAEISGGEATGGGGNFFVQGALTIRDNATISDGVAKTAGQKYAHNIYLNDGVLNLEGGIVEGYISAVNQGHCEINISGSPEVNKGETNLRLTYTGTGVTTYPTIKIVGELTGEGKIGIRLEDKANYRIDGAAHTGLFISNENGAKAAYEKFFYADVPTGGEVIYMEDGLNVHGEGYRVACACGGRLEGSAWHTCEQKTWKPWKSADNLPDEGYYYLSSDVTGAYVNINGLKTARELGIDLNGHTVTGRDKYRIFRLMDGNATDNTYTYTLTVTDNGNGKGKLIPVDNIGDQGSVIWMTEKNQTVNIFGGTIDGTGKTTTTTSGGMLVSVSRGVLNIYDGTIIGGTTPGNGAAIGVQYNDGGGTVNMYGGTIVGGNANNGRAIYVAYNSDANQGTFNMYGGSVVDGENTTGTNLFSMVGRMTLGGDAQIEELYLAAGKVLTLHSSLDASKASVGLKMNTPGVFASNVETDISDMFTCLNKGCAIRYNADKTLEMFTQHTHCFCYGAEVLPEGHTCNEDQIWQPVERTPGVVQTLADGGFYYLNWTGESAQPLLIPAGATVHLCLNGASIRASNVLQLAENAKLVICDCSEGMTGVITTTQNAPLNLYKAGSSVILMSGNITGTYGNDVSVITAKVAADTTFEMYGGKLHSGCSNTSASKKETSGRGGNLTVDGTVKLMGGSIEGGKYGSNNRDVTVFANAGSHFTVGGKIRIGYTMVANGAIIHVVEKDFDGNIGVTMASTTKPIAYVTTDVSGCFHSVHDTYSEVVWKNGALYLSKPHQHCFCVGAEALPEGHKCDTLTVWTAVEKSNGSSTTLEDGGHYYLNWTGYSAQSIVVADKATAYLCLNGATIYAAQAITVGAGSTLYICDCSEEETGMIAVSGASTSAPITMNSGLKVVNLMSGTINGTYSDNKQVAVSLSGGTPTFNMYGGTIKGGYGTGNGGNVTLTGANATFNMHGGIITGGSVASGKHGGNVLIAKGHFVMYGGLITGGKATDGKGGNVMLLGVKDSGQEITFDMYGGKITNGEAKNGGNMCVNALTGCTATFTMTGGEISGGIVAENGSNLFLYGSRDTATIKGGTIVGGKDTVYNNGGNLTMP